MSWEDDDWDWRTVCKDFLFASQVPQLELVLQNHYAGNTTNFIQNFLEPVWAVLRDIQVLAEDCFSNDAESQDAWRPYYEQFVCTIIHFLAPESSHLHKGDFYFSLSPTNPGKLHVKYYNAGQVLSHAVEPSELTTVWDECWADDFRKRLKGRFLFLNCITVSSRGIEKRPWRYLMSKSRHFVVEQTKATQETPRQDVDSRRVTRLSMFVEKPMNVFDVSFELLHTGVACLTGARDVRGGAVVTIDTAKPDWSNVQCSCEELAKLLMYFHQIPRQDTRSLGFSVIVDARKSGTKRKALEDIVEAIACFQDSCPGGVHMVYIVTKKNSPLIMFNSSKVKEQVNFEFKLLTAVEELKNYIDKTQLTPEFGGAFRYDHDQWIRFRIKLEPFITGCRSAAKMAMEVMQEFSKSRLGDSVQDCQALLDHHHHKVKEVFEDSRLSALQVEGEQILIRFHEHELSLPATDDYTETVDCVTKLYRQMNEVFCKLEVLSEQRSNQLDQCLALKQFDEDVEQVMRWIRVEGQAFLEKQSEIGDSIGHVRSLQQEFDKFDSTSKLYCDRAENLMEEGSSLCQGAHYESVGIRERRRLLADVYRNFCTTLEERRKKLELCMEFHQLALQASEWSVNTLRQMALMDMGEILTLEGVILLKDQLQRFLVEAPPWSEARLHRISELATNLGVAKLVQQAEQTLARYTEVQAMLSKRQETLQRAEDRLKGHVAVEESSTATGGSDESSNSSPQQDEDLCAEVSDDEQEKPLTHVDNAPPPPLRRQLSQDKTGLMFTWDQTEGSHENVPLSPKVEEKLMYIVQEMVDTEADYVKSLEYIIENYVSEMENQELLPSLKGKKNILFGNIERIYEFHKRHFLQELEACRNKPLLVGSCFLKWERQFYLYALYNKNKPSSDLLLSDHGNVYFRQVQNKLGDKLDLGSYLIKPVQRMGKYCLLLKDMVKIANGQGRRTAELKAAEEIVKFQLRHGNDLLAMDSLRACDVNVKEQGRLLRQGNFVVWQGKKKHSRRVFMFDELVIFSKAKRQPGGVDLFYYKNSIKTADMGLTESVGESGLKFELWFRRRIAKETYVLQAPSLEVKTAWLTEITRLLWKQAMRSKEYGLTEASTGISVGSQPPLLIPSTHVSDTPLFSALPDALSPPLMRTNGTPPSGPSPTASRRLSWVGPENASSVDSTTSGGMCDANIHSIDEDRIRGRCASEGGKYGNQGRGYSASLTEGDANSNHNDSVVKQLDRTPICDSETSKSEDKKVGFFFRTFSLREKGSERQRTKSSDEAVTGVVRRSLREKDFNTVPRRRSLIDRISSRSSSEEKPSRRRSLQILKPIVKEEPRDQTQHDAVTAPQTHKQSTQV